MKNFKDIKNVLNKTYDSVLEFTALKLANVLNRNLKTILIRQGKDPDVSMRDLFDKEFKNWGYSELLDKELQKNRARQQIRFASNKKLSKPLTSERLIEKISAKIAKEITAPLVPIIVDTVPPMPVSPPPVETTPEVLVQVGFDIGSSVPSSKPRKRAARKRVTKKAAK